MKLSQKAADLLLSDSQLRLKMALALKFTETWIRVLAQKNSENGPLTTAAALEVFRDNTDLKSEQDQLVKEENLPIAS